MIRSFSSTCWHSRTLHGLLLIIFLSPGLARSQLELPPVAALQERINQATSSAPANGSSDLSLLHKALTQRQELDSIGEQLASLNAELEAAPARIEELKATLTAAAPRSNGSISENLDKLPVPSLEARVTELSNRLDKLQAAQADANSRRIRFRTLPEQARAAIDAQNENLNRAEKALLEIPEAAPADDSRRIQLLIERELASRRIEWRRAQLQGINRLLELASLESELLGRKVADAGQSLQAAQDTLNRKRATLTRQSLASMTQEAAADFPPELRDYWAENARFRERIIARSGEFEKLTRQNRDISAQLEETRQNERSLREQIDALSDSLLLSRVLYEQQARLIQVQPFEGLTDRIAEIRLRQFSIAQQRESLRNPEFMIGTQFADVEPVWQDTLPALLDNRSALLGQLDAELTRALNLLIELDANQKQLIKISNQLRKLISERLFWMPSSRPLDLDWLSTLPEALSVQLAAVLDGSHLEAAVELVRPVDFRIAPFALIALLLLMARRRIHRQLAKIAQRVGKLRQDNQLMTPQALLLNVFLALPGPMLLAGAGWLIANPDTREASVASLIVLKLSGLWLVMAWLALALSPNGIAEKHFRWSAEVCSTLHRRLLVVGCSLAPILMLAGYGKHMPADLADDRLSLILMALTGLLLSISLLRLTLAWPGQSDLGRHLLRNSMAILLSLLPFGLTALACLGYFYTAVILADRLVDSLYLLWLWLLVEATAMRGLVLAARQLAYRRALERRQAQPTEGPDGTEPVQEPPMDMEQVSQQSLRLTRLALFAGFGVLLYWTWLDLLTAFSYTENITLWQQQVGEGDNASQVSTSLSDVLSGLLIFVVSIVLTRNLPGLLEVTLLPRLKLAPGTTYAVTTLLSYVIIGIGVVASLSTVGFSWGKLQWLVAALGVGLGFGLQEIFANFVSGIIILFERPIRIGDTITIGELNGNVSRIRIRATTITDFDRKEIVVPNKTFITDRLINWSLSDTVTRIVLRIGVAYGSDVARVRELLLQAAHANARVMPEPAPQVFFTAFGASSLDHELRVHVRVLSDRLPATDELNKTIDRLFAENGIVIAFNQLDVHLHQGEAQSPTPAAPLAEPEPPRPAGATPDA